MAGVLPGHQSPGQAVGMGKSVLLQMTCHNIGPVAGAAYQNDLLIFRQIQTAGGKH